MHVPDGYLSPSTCAVLYAASAPFWYVATRKVKRLIAGRFVPLIAVFAAFSFVIMMFNIPLPGGTTGHAVGASLVAIVLGPWAAMLAVSVALAIQALFFGDGGVLAFGANAFNMAVAMPLVASGAYRFVAGKSPGSRRRMIAAAVAGYLALNAAALLTAVEFGVQPLLFTAADGAPLYAPYPLGIAVPAMLVPHLLVAGPAEALVTALAIAFLARTNPELLRLAATPSAGAGGQPSLRRLWAAIGALVVVSPIGILAAGTAWGEWDPADAADWPLPFVPEGLQRFSGLWSAPMPDYVVPLLGEGTEAQLIGYIISAAAGIAILLLVAYIVGYLFGRAGERREKHRQVGG